MEARFLFQGVSRRIFGIFQDVCVLILFVTAAGAQYETANFSVSHAPTSEFAKQCCETAEQCRREMSILWLGNILPDWSAKCPISVNVGDNLGAGGFTSFIPCHGEVYGWEMNIQGSAKRILDSVLPHEITHMILASHFRQPLPRWLDEGAATSTEHPDEKENYRRMLRIFLSEESRKGLPFKRMVALKEYPDDPMPFYAQGFSVIEYLLILGKQIDSLQHQRLVRFADTGIQSNDWAFALQKHYGIESLGALQVGWVKWVGGGFNAETNLPTVTASETTEPATPSLIRTSSVPPPAFAFASQPITPVNVNLLPLQGKYEEKYGKSVYEKKIIPIPVKVEDDSSQVIPIPAAVIRGQSTAAPIRFDPAIQPLRR
jgi:hypothetical protein